ncbi:MAG: PsiF family protein, partial [Zoogloeaceae bacterium]|nr:PsiF family protein [Zoogloeaceae bacterium]
MKNRNAEAGQKELKGQERRDFMKVCLSGKNAATGNHEK